MSTEVIENVLNPNLFMKSETKFDTVEAQFMSEYDAGDYSAITLQKNHLGKRTKKFAIEVYPSCSNIKEVVILLEFEEKNVHS